MIHKKRIPPWQLIQQQNFSSLAALLAFLEMDKKSISLAKDIPINIPLRLAKKMEKKNIHDPLFRQFVFLQQEKPSSSKNFSLDPNREKSFHRGLLMQKYQKRALILASRSCAMQCCFCFRQHFVFPPIEKEAWEKAFLDLEKEKSIEEIILSGGDPLAQEDEILDYVLSSLEKIPHLRRIRIHSRFPIGIPERIDRFFLALLKKCRKQLYFVIHCNHPNELDEEIFAALKNLQKLGITLLNQTVLLKGINDRVETLEKLSRLLSDRGILFYYLHQLDEVRGAESLKVSIEKGKELVCELEKRLPGYGVPKYVKELPGKPSKVNLLTSYRGS